jgi:hypothetical protein
MNYSVVSFQNEDCIEAVPHKWLYKINDQIMCKWPSHNQTEAIAKFKDPTKNWQSHPCTILKTGFQNIQMAKQHLNILTVHTDSESYRASLRQREEERKHPVRKILQKIDYNKNWNDAANTPG